MKLSGDNQMDLQMNMEARLLDPSKNICIYYHFIREKVELSAFVLKYVPSQGNELTF